MHCVKGYLPFLPDGKGSAVLRKVDMPIISNEECSKGFKNAGFPTVAAHVLGTRVQFCAGHKGGGKDTCNVSKIFPRS